MSELVDQARLAELEAVVDRGLQTFYEVGSALLEIREQRLYRQSHKTFEWYCRERFGFSDSRGRQLIAAARTVTAVTEQGLPAPRTEREARELARQLRAQADELDGGRDEQLAALAHLEEAARLIRVGDAEMRKTIEACRLAIGEARLALDAETDGQDDAEAEQIIAEAERIIEHAYAFLDEEVGRDAS